MWIEHKQVKSHSQDHYLLLIRRDDLLENLPEVWEIVDSIPDTSNIRNIFLITGWSVSG